VLQDALILSLYNIFESWVVDSWALFHATPNRKYFKDYVQGEFEQVYFGDDEPCKIVGMGKVKIKLKNGNQSMLKQVRHVLELKRSLISIGQLGSEGSMSTFTDKVWKVTKRSLVIAKIVGMGKVQIKLKNGNQ